MSRCLAGSTCNIHIQDASKATSFWKCFCLCISALALYIILLHIINNNFIDIAFIMSKMICVLTCSRNMCKVFEWYQRGEILTANWFNVTQGVVWTGLCSICLLQCVIFVVYCLMPWLYNVVLIVWSFLPCVSSGHQCI